MAIMLPTLSSNIVLSSFHLETGIFIEDALKCFQDKVSPENLLLLLTDSQAWEKFVAAAKFTRDEADEFREALNKLARYMVVKDKNWHEKDQQHKEWFLKEFPRLKMELEDHIGSSVPLQTGFRRSTEAPPSPILGLAPETDGLGLGLLEAGKWLGLTSAVTGMTSSAVEYAKKVMAEAQGQGLIKRSNTDVLKVIGRTSAEGEELVERVAERPALALSRGTVIAGAASGGILLVLDVVNLVYETKHLHEGAESELAEELKGMYSDSVGSQRRSATTPHPAPPMERCAQPEVMHDDIFCVLQDRNPSALLCSIFLGTLEGGDELQAGHLTVWASEGISG
ncbi:hypothetical protein P7K49_002908 [Saguinus oedipus]|uniref:Apolipoprotein L2 n=1 Tax=Saguinus oedipus TaxID=9490 RepID=A0ABQ9WMN9_SAGOE|nr:hypothetical protein P7K49_002908 [Saguinus oedipus]